MSDVFEIFHADPAAGRTELHEKLHLTGCETSINTLPAGVAVPFVHRHTKNEELYGVLAGRGELYLDGVVHPIVAGDWFRISPEGRRAIRAAAGSLEGFTMTDGVPCEEKAPWH